ncbi:hypothetical protein AMP1_7 [Burkholderia phage AMP1]|uniref:Uncharacterized protein n=5 Tax=Ampunavirus BpAMP1 TaxID=2733589 RepID=A0A5C2IFQ9_9CAUD|nr:hypothetical protein HOQ94_gp10 [Burkholderia phage Bp-AMP1]QEP52834.1 hypothetical protein AMP1_7 [Burkholderia phage AMP1]CDL65165.1 hypothetical protein [Burkholderia phage Bp-AMP2]CDL65205.1 hypothetical protein [Burkholderia phage Bp-AMP3]CDL65246.1 hypothetical protein [Burkholderia phage Bp-AMP4]CDK30079.1 hypothetical protein [Burkholderia phage Bp-AMP1]
MTEKKYLDKVALDKLITSIEGRGKKLQDDVQKAALSALHIVNDGAGDIGPANRLLLAVPSGMRRTALASYLVSFGKLKLNEDKETKREKPVVFDSKRPGDTDGASGITWYNFQPEPELNSDTVFDLHAAVVALIRKASKGNNDTEFFRRILAAAPSDVLEKAKIPQEIIAKLAPNQSTEQTV